MKEKLETLFERLSESHAELMDMVANGSDNSELNEAIVNAEGAMQDVKAHLQEAYSLL